MAGRAAGELDDLRAALADALDRTVAARPDLLVIVGSGPVTRLFEPAAVGTLAGFGLPLAVRLDGAPAADPPSLPLSLTMGAWLLARQRVGVPRMGRSVAAGLPAMDCAALGASIAGSTARVGLLVMGDGSARRGDKSPGYADPRAEPFDVSITAALAAADPAALLAVDVDLAASLLAAGRAPWQVLAGAAAGCEWLGHVTYDAAPYGVQYTVATWERT